MPDIKWIKITTDMFDDEKIKVIESMPGRDAILIVWIKLLTLAGKVNMGGLISLTDTIQYSDEMLAAVFSRPLNTVRLAIETFVRFGMVERIDKGLFIANFAKHQNIEGMEKARELTRQRVARLRLKQKENVTLQGVTDGNSVTRYTQNGNASLKNNGNNILENVNSNKKTVDFETNNPSDVTLRNATVTHLDSDSDIKTQTKTKIIYTAETPEMKLSLLLKDLILRNDEKAKVPQNGDIQKWCVKINELIRIDGRTPDDVEKVIKFSQSDSFWKANIQSPTKLRDKFSQLWIKANDAKENFREKKVPANTTPIKGLIVERH